MADASLSAARLRELLHYDSETGLFTWAKPCGRFGRILAGTVAGSPNAYGHLRINIDGSLYYCHRLAWLYMTGAWPMAKIDHLDGCRANNVWRNLRDVSQHVNTQNRRTAVANKKSGLPLGVSVDKRDGAIRADITVNGKAKSLGRFKTPEEAHAAYLEAKRRLHAGCTI